MAASSEIVYLDRDDHRPQRRCLCCSLGLGLILSGAIIAVIGLLYDTVVPAVVDNAVKHGVVTCDPLEGEKESYIDPYGDCKACTPYYYSLYMMNATNAEAYLAGDADTLQVREMGPYTYRRREIKVHVHFAPDQTRVSYKKYTYHTYEPSRSCTGCATSDKAVALDMGYMSVIAAAGGEREFLMRLALGSFARGNTTAARSAVATHGRQMMRWINGLNSLDPHVMRTVTTHSAVLTFLLTGPAALANLNLAGFGYNGLFAKRSISHWARGSPSLLAGLVLGSNYVNQCAGANGLEAQCAACKTRATSPACLAISNECTRCARGASVVAHNNETCAALEATYASAYGDDEALAFVASTCHLCDTVGLCAAPLPGLVESSGRDYSRQAPPASILSTYTLRTGCDNRDFIHEFEQFDGYTTSALWVDLGARRNPTLSEMSAFASYGNCAAPTANLTCSPVTGNDGTSIAPGGVSISGFEDAISLSSFDIYMSQGRQNVSILNQHQQVTYKDMTLHRFRPSTSLLSMTATNANMGTGYPVDGVQCMAFTVGFLGYLSFPMFLYGDDSLTTNVQITMNDGVQVSHDSLYDSAGTLVTKYSDKYETFLDLEAGTGKTMRALKRLMASYALSPSASNGSRAMSDVLYPALETEVLIPVYWGEEGSTITDSQVDDYASIVTLLDSMVPVLIVAIVVGVLLGGAGAFVRRHRRNQVLKAVVLE